MSLNPNPRGSCAPNMPTVATVKVTKGGATTEQPTVITANDWNHPRWIEQPVSDHMVKHGPGEDFAEAAMTYVEQRRLLQERCPARFAFLEEDRESWLPLLMSRPPVGDFPPPPSGTARTA